MLDVIHNVYGMNDLSFTVCENETVSTASLLPTPIQPAEWENNSSLTAEEFAQTYPWFSFDGTIGATSWNNVYFQSNGYGIGGVQYIAYLGEGDLYMSVETDVDMNTDTDLGNPKITGFQYRVSGEPQSVTIENIHIYITSILYLNPKYIGIDNYTIMLDNNLLAVNSSQVIANGEVSIDGHIADKFGMSESTEWVPGEGGGGTADTTPQLYTNEYATDQMLFTEDNNGNALDTVLPMDALDSITITVWLHPVGNALTANWDGNDTWVYNDNRTSTSYNIVYDSGLGGFLVNYPRAAWENYGDEDLNIFFSWGGSSGEWITTTTPLHARFVPVDNDTITVSNGVLVATVSGGGGIATESDPVFSASPAATITASDISNWNAFEGVPSASIASDGDVLTVSNGDAVWTAISQVPTYSYANLNQVLGIQIQDTRGLRAPAEVELAWVDLPEELPDYSRASEGDVLTVDSNGDLEWNAPASGGGDVEIDNRPENPSESDTGSVELYNTPSDGDMAITINNTEYEYQNIGDELEPEYDWSQTGMSSTSVDSGGMSVVYEDNTTNTREDAAYGCSRIGFTISTEREMPGEEGEDPTTETKIEEFNWCPDHIQLRDQTSGDIYELTISHGQIVLTNISL